MRIRRVFVLACAVLAIGLVFPRKVNAAMMRHTDLTSLALESDAVVRAKRGARTKVAEYTTLTDTLVIHSYKGALAAGDHVKLDYGLYATRSPFDTIADAGAASDEVILFLTANHEAAMQRQWDAGLVQDWYITTAGMRQEIGGVVQRFEQWSNPGGFAPVPQGRDPYDLVHDARGKITYTMTTFEPELLSALGRAAATEAAMNRASTEAGRDELVALVGPEDPDDPSIPIRTGFVGFYADVRAEMIIERIGREKDVVRVVRALARARGRVESHRLLNAQLSVAEIARLASDHALPVRERVAAISLLGWPRDEPLARRTVIALLEDPDSEIRTAAASVPPSEPAANDPFVNAIARHFRTDPDARVRLAIKQTAWNLQRPRILDGRAPNALILDAHREGRELHVNWGTVADTDVRITNIEVVATGPVTQKIIFAEKDLEQSRSSASGSAVLGLAFDPPLAFGKYDLAVDVTLAQEGKTTTHHFALAPLVANAGAKIPVYTFDAGASDSATWTTLTNDASSPPTESATQSANDAGDSRAVAPAPPASHACACDLAHAHSNFGEREIPAFFSAISLSLTFVFRRARRARRSHEVTRR